MPADLIVQHRLYSLLPGSPGGRALRDLRTPLYFSLLGSLGELQTVKRYRSKYRRQLGQLGALARRRQRDTLPATLSYLDGGDLVEVRRVPWWLHQPRRCRRQRPVLVRVEVRRVSVTS